MVQLFLTWRIILTALALLLVLGCSSVNNNTNSIIKAEQLSAIKAKIAPDNWASTSYSSKEYIDQGWVSTFNDPILGKLIEKALKHNHNLKSAEANLNKALAEAQKSNADLAPTVNMSSNIKQAKSIHSNKIDTREYAALLNISWELDVWERIKSSASFESDNYYASKYDYQAARQSLAAQTAKAYFLVIERTKQLELRQAFHKNLTQTTEITEAFYRQDMSSLQDVYLARVSLANSAKSVSNAKSAKLSALRSLEALVGNYPSASLKTSKIFTQMPKPIATGIPSNILERRADIRAAERRISAAFHDTQAARAAKLPSIALTGSLGASSSQLSTLTDSANLLWNAAGSLLLPIFNGGKLDAEINIKTAEQELAIANYQQIALNAFLEVENALTNEVLFREKETHINEALQNAEIANIIASENYQQGEIELLDLLQIKRETISIQLDQTAIQKELLDQRIHLSLALGAQI